MSRPCLALMDCAVAKAASLRIKRRGLRAVALALHDASAIRRLPHFLALEASRRRIGVVAHRLRRRDRRTLQAAGARIETERHGESGGDQEYEHSHVIAPCSKKAAMIIQGEFTCCARAHR